MLTVRVLPSVPASVRLLLTVRVFDVVPPATENPVARAVSVRPLTLVGVIAPSVSVMAGVVVEVTVPDMPFAVTTDTLVTAAEVAHAAVPPLTVRIWPVVPMARRVELLAPLPIIRSPVDVTGDRALNPADAVVWPVPPLATASVPANVTAPEEAVLGVRPVVPAEKVVTPALAIEIEPAPLVMVIPVPCVRVVRVKPVPLPMSSAPLAGVDVRPVPPFAMGNVPVTSVVRAT